MAAAKKVHFIGIGGVSMSGIAKIMLQLGYNVSGSDIKDSPRLQELAALGAAVKIGHTGDNLDSADAVVVSTAIPADNPEITKAREQGIPVLHRAEMLGRLMEGKKGIAVSGTHGKTTTTSMISSVLIKAGFDPTVVIGGELDEIGSNSRLGSGEFMVVEADESDGSFVHLNPAVAVITNIEADHLDHYKEVEAIVAAFVRFAERTPEEDGLIVICADDPACRKLVPVLNRRTVTYGFSADAFYRCSEAELHPFGSESTIFRGKEKLGDLVLTVPGRHNILNALAAMAVCLETGVEWKKIREALSRFKGARRRFELMGECNGIMVVDDYAHHPTEIKATLAAARCLNRRVVAVFQPHRYTRTQHLMHEFAAAFGQADRIILTDIYPAFEKPIPGVSGGSLYGLLRRREGDRVLYAGNLQDVVSLLRSICRPGDLVLTMGAGNINQAAAAFLKSLQNDNQVVRGS